MRCETKSILCHALGMGEAVVCQYSGEIVCYGLGSCVGVFLYDKWQEAGAGAHIMLPGVRESFDIITAIVEGMKAKGCHPYTMYARIVGGANIMAMPNCTVGERNIDYVKDQLKKRKIMIRTEDTGGTQCRTARMDVLSGTLSVSTGGNKCFTL